MYSTSDGVEHRHAGELQPLRPGRHAADDLGAVVEALQGNVHGLAAVMPWMIKVVSLSIRIDMLTGLLRVLRQISSGQAGGLAHGHAPVDERNLVLRENLSLLPPGRECGRWQCLTRSNPDSMTPLMTPRAVVSTRVLLTTFIMTAIFSTPGFKDELGQLARLGDAGVTRRISQ